MRKPTLIYSISLAITLSLTWSVGDAFATKLNAQPLPHDRDTQDFSDNDDSETIIPATATRFSRRHDYREDDKQKKEAEEKAKKDAVTNAQKTQQSRVDAYKQQIETAVAANNAAVAFGKQGRWDEAIAQHEKACQYDPSNKQFRINLSAARCAFGEQRMAKGDLTAAVSLFRKSLAIAPDNGLAGRCLVQCLKKMGYDPSSADVRIQLGDQLSSAGDLQGAAIEYTQAMQLEPSARTYLKMGDMAYRCGQAAQAEAWYRQAIVKDPDSGAAYRQLGFVQMASRNNTAAAASLRKAVILDAKDVAAGQALVDMWRKQVSTNPLLAENHLGLAGALQLTGDFVGAESQYNKLEALDPKNPGLESGRASLARAYQHAKAEKHRLAAETLFDQGLKRESLEEIAQAVTLEPRNASYQYLLGECLETAGDYQGAHQAYLTCVLIDPENNKEAAARIRMMQERGNVNAAQTSQMANQLANKLSNQYGQQATSPMVAAPQAVAAPQTQPQSVAPIQTQPMMPARNDPAAMGFRKSMYEGGSGAGNQPVNSPLGFRTHDESQEGLANQVYRERQAPAAVPTATAAQAAPAAHPTINDGMSQVTDAEAQRDYNTAISLLRDISNNNLQNPEIHHRLAVNLLAAGQIAEAISEFRIASALSPAKKAYSDDLAQALAINKRSLMTDATTTVGQATNGATGAGK